VGEKKRKEAAAGFWLLKLLLWILILTIHDTAGDEYDPSPTNQSIVFKYMQT
jgi:hypothetical protein